MSDSGIYDDQKSETDSFDDIIGRNYGSGEAEAAEKRALDQHGFDQKFDDIAANEKAREGKDKKQDGDGAEEGKSKDDDSDDADAVPKKKKRGWKGLSKKAKGGIIGGAMSLGLGGFGYWGFMISSPILEFVHLDKMVSGPHLDPQQNGGNSRISKMYRFWKSGGSFGATRLNMVERHYYNKAMEQISKAGIRPALGTTDIQDGFIIDRTSPDSPYKGMSPEEALNEFDRRMSGTKFHAKATAKLVNGEVELSTKGLLGDSAANAALLKSTGTGWWETAAGGRSLSRFGMAPGWHNLGSIPDRAIAKGATGVADYFKEKWGRIFNGDGAPPSSLNAAAAREENGGTDPHGNPTSDPAPGPSGPLTDSKSITSSLRDFAKSPKGQITGALTFVAGILCVFKTINENVGKLRYIQVIKPLVNIGMAMVSVGDQVMSGQDVNLDELQYLSQYFDNPGQKDANGKVTVQPSSWTDAKPIRQNNGDTGGVDANQGLKDTLHGDNVSGLAWTESEPMKILCSDAGKIISGAVGLILGVFSGGITSTIVQGIAGSFIIGHAIDFFTNLLAGHAVDVTNVVESAGANFGNYVDYGVTIGANAMALQNAGTQLTQQQQTALLNDSMDLENQQRSKESFFARAFDPMDPKSITGNLIDQNKGSFSANMAALTNAFMHFGSTVVKAPFNLIGAKAHAIQEAYQYPFPVYGMSLEDQNNPAVENPFQNAAEVGSLLSGAEGQKYIDKSNKCFGDNITQMADTDGQMVWGVIPTTNVSDPDSAPDKITAYDSGYDDRGCNDSSDPNWIKVRFFIYDTRLADSLACVQWDDAQGCADDNGGDAAAAPAATGSVPTGDAKTLASQILSNSNISFQTPDEQTYMQHIADTGHATDCGAPAVDPRLLGDLLAISQQFKIVVGVLDDGHGDGDNPHGCDGGFHPKGMAADINGINPINGSGGTGTQIGNRPINGQFAPEEMDILRQFYGVAGGIMASNGGGNIGQIECFDTKPPAVNGVVFFHDTCSHVHLDVGPAGADGN